MNIKQKIILEKQLKYFTQIFKKTVKKKNKLLKRTLNQIKQGVDTLNLTEINDKIEDLTYRIFKSKHQMRTCEVLLFTKKNMGNICNVINNIDIIYTSEIKLYSNFRYGVKMKRVLNSYSHQEFECEYFFKKTIISDGDEEE